MDQSQDLSPKKKLAFTAIVLLFTVVFISLIYLAYIAYRAYPIYSNIKSGQRGWVGKVHQSDSELGFAPVPNSRGAEVYPIGDAIAMRYDEHGFRIPVNDSRNSSGIPNDPHPKILALGCSFTYGSSVLAEEAYPYLVGKQLGGVAINSGVCSYGLSQMLILAKKIVAKHKPDYLVVQYSPWLIDRAMNQFAPVYFGTLPVPYFYESDGVPILHSLAFSNILSDLPIDKFKNSPKSAIGFLSFLLDVGFPMFIHDDFNLGILAIQNKLGIIPAPTHDAQIIVQYVYGEISRIANENHAKLIIVALGNGSEPVILPYQLFPKGAIFVDAHKAMLEKLPVVDEQNYSREYMLWRGNPPVVVDGHPNAKAHGIIAEAIVSKIKSTPLSSPSVAK